MESKADMKDPEPTTLQDFPVHHAGRRKVMHPELERGIHAQTAVRYLRFLRPVRVARLDLPLVAENGLCGRWVPNVPTHPAHVLVSVMDRAANRWFLWINGVACAFGVLDQATARQALANLEAKRGELFPESGYPGLPLNLLSIAPTDHMLPRMSYQTRPTYENYMDMWCEVYEEFYRSGRGQTQRIALHGHEWLSTKKVKRFFKA